MARAIDHDEARLRCVIHDAQAQPIRARCVHSPPNEEDSKLRASEARAVVFERAYGSFFDAPGGGEHVTGQHGGQETRDGPKRFENVANGSLPTMRRERKNCLIKRDAAKLSKPGTKVHGRMPKHDLASSKE